MAAPAPRVVSLSSSVHRAGRINLGYRLTMLVPGLWQDAAAGALPTLAAALDPDAVPDGFYGPQNIFGTSGPAGPAGVRAGRRTPPWPAVSGTVRSR